MSPFGRLGVYAGGLAIGIGLTLFAEIVSVWAAVAAAVIALVLAVVVTLERAPELPASSDVAKPEEARDELPTGSLRMRPRQAIALDAERARRREGDVDA